MYWMTYAAMEGEVELIEVVHFHDIDHDNTMWFSHPIRLGKMMAYVAAAMG